MQLLEKRCNFDQMPRKTGRTQSVSHLSHPTATVDNCGDKLIDQEELLDTCYGWVGLVLEQGPLANQ